MAAMSGCSGDCALQRSLNKLLTIPSASPRVKTQSEALYIISLERYGRDPNFVVYFPDSISMSDSLYDATVTDGHCRVRVSLDPSLNRLIHRNKLRCGCVVRNVVFSATNEGEGNSRTFHIRSLDVDSSGGSDAALLSLFSVNVDSLPWVMGDEPSLVPLRARRSTYLPLWNNHDFIGEAWRHTPPSQTGVEDSEEEYVVEDAQPVVSLAELRRRFLSGSLRRRGALCVRIMHKSRLMYYGKADQSCECPYKAELQVADSSISVRVVLWNSVCLDWYRCLQPGQVLRLSRYRVKDSYSNRSGEDAEPNIEISLNSRNPTAKVAIIPKQQVLPEWDLPDLPHNFLSGYELQTSPHSTICDVIGVVVFVGRQERIGSKDGRRSEFEEYRWLQLTDGTTDQLITIKLFSTSQPDIQSRIQPMVLIVCTRLKLIRNKVGSATTFGYLSNTLFTQVYCTGTGSHSAMPYRGIRPVRQFLQWLKQVDEANMLDRAVIGGYFSYPPLPVSLQSFMENRQGEAGLISGGELRLRCDRLHYRETQRFIVQCTITAACYHSRQDMGRTQNSDTLTAQLSPRVPRQREGSDPFKTPTKRKLLFTSGASSSTPRKRLAPPFQQSSTEEDAENDFSLFDGAMEFLVGDNNEDEEEDDEDFSTPPSSPIRSHLGTVHVAAETLPRRFCYERRHVQAAAVGLQTNSFHKVLPHRELESFSPAQCYTGYFTLTMKVLSDGVLLDVIFFPATPGNLHWKPLPLTHDNTWESVLSHGGFSSHAPPPSPADLIATAAQLTNQRMVCVLEACALGGDKVELILNCAFPLRS
ncbi:RPA-related protein RADX [Tachysurus fulvidraco]|uniref:RPA-related protein RADX n=1 Tax=Tachysurus fulvidraco TaxID=1234273 RepID=UPI000F4E2686|nr:RPA-related protein RADX [Tachysurus fulvidraco]